LRLTGPARTHLSRSPWPPRRGGIRSGLALDSGDEIGAKADRSEVRAESLWNAVSTAYCGGLVNLGA